MNLTRSNQARFYKIVKKAFCFITIFMILIQPVLAAKTRYRHKPKPIHKTNRFYSLQQKLYPIVYKNYGRQVLRRSGIGISFRDVASGYKVSINGNKTFPAASIIKLPVMAYLFYLSDKKLVGLNQKIRFSNADKLPGAGVLQWLRPTSYTLWNLCRLMISISDNTATRLLVNRLGKRKITLYARKIGLKNTYVLDQTALVEPPKRNVNLTTPNDICYLLYKIESRKGFSKSSRKDMLSFMLNQKYRFGIPFVLPKKFACANKTGNLSNILHDAAIVYSPRGKYVLCVFTKGFKRDHNARKVINKVSEIVAKYYE